MQVGGWQHEVGGARWWARLLSYGALIGTLLGVFGPFGSFLNGSFLVLLTHWILMTVFGATSAGFVVPRLTDIGVRKGMPVLFALAVALLLVSIPVSAVSSVEARWLWPWQTARLRLLDWYVQTLVIMLFATGGWIVIEIAIGREKQREQPDKAHATSRSPEPEEVICLQMEDHYVRIHHRTGSTLELMTLQQAIARYGRQGLQVHRSWWVEIGAVAAVEKDGRNWRLRLSNGLCAPIARNRITTVRASGIVSL